MATTSVTGVDGIVPVYNPNQRWQTWAMSEIYTGQQGNNRYVPNVNDYVVDYATDEHFKVIAVDPTTLLSTLEPLNNPVTDVSLTATDVLLGVGPGTQNDTLRVYVDSSVLPATLSVDESCYINGVMAKYAKIFTGSLLDGTAEVVSAVFDQSGNFISDSMMLELVNQPGGANFATKAVPACYTKAKIKDGDILTLVIYSETGGVVSKRQLLAENTSYIRTLSSPVKYIESISLKSPFMSPTDPLLLQIPLNVLTESLNLKAVLNYSDGSSLEMPVDGNKFTLMGLNNFVASIPDQKTKLVLRYILATGEISYEANTNGSSRFVSKTYQVQTINADGAYTLKLYGFPVWVDATNGYRMKWFLLNLDRNVFYDVTGLVVISAISGGFKPTAYGVNQQLTVSINLNKVNGIYKNYDFTQTISVVLLQSAADHSSTPWTVGFDPNQNPQFGNNNVAKTKFVNQNLTTLDISCGETVLANWLDRVYYRTEPLVNNDLETQAPQPTMFSVLLDDGTETVFPISAWNQALTINHAITDSSTLYVKFFIRNQTTDIILAVAGLPVNQQN